MAAVNDTAVNFLHILIICLKPEGFKHCKAIKLYVKLC